MRALADAPLEPLLSRDDLAAIFRVDPRTIDRWRERGLLSAIKLNGGAVRFRREDVEALIRQGQEPLLPPAPARTDELEFR